jgi:phosphoserine phosphatase
VTRYLILQSPIGQEEKLADFLKRESLPPTQKGIRYVRFAAEPIAEVLPQVIDRAHAYGLDANIASALRPLSSYRLFATDMDSTLVKLETLDEMASASGKGDEVARITEMAMQGKISNYAESLKARVALLKGVDAGIIDQVIAGPIQPNPGAAELIHAVRAAGLKTMLISGGFSLITEAVKKQFNLDLTFSNEIGIDAHGKLTGEVTGPNGGPIIDGEGKLACIRLIAKEVGCSLDQAVAMGDGSNDIPMLQAAGMSVAWHAKEKVRPRAKQALDFAPLSGILPFFAEF